MLLCYWTAFWPVAETNANLCCLWRLQSKQNLFEKLIGLLTIRTDIDYAFCLPQMATISHIAKMLVFLMEFRQSERKNGLYFLRAKANCSYTKLIKIESLSFCSVRLILDLLLNYDIIKWSTYKTKPIKWFAIHCQIYLRLH